MNARIARMAAILLTMALLVSLSSCQQFFTASLAGYLARDSYTIPADISVADAAELLAGGDANVAAALVAPLYNATSAAAPGTAAYDEAASALVTAVVLSSDASPAIFSIVEDLGTEDLGTLTQPQIDAALATLMSISLTSAESAALVLISDDPAAPDGAAPDELYIAAFALAVDAFNDGDASEADLDTWLGGGALPGTVDSDSVNAAMALLDLAQAADLASGSTSIFGQLMSGLSFE
ncbi:MAG TPA: hypothetical protein VMX33_12980 [bacterium]|nr:hypothetical protein [bacterium]